MALCRGSARLAYRAVKQVEQISYVDLPAFLCPALLRVPCAHWPLQQRRTLHTAQEQTTIPKLEPTSEPLPVPKSAAAAREAISLAKLSPQCPGCGALTQTTEKDSPGYFNLKRKTVKDFLEVKTEGTQQKREDAIIEQSLKLAAEFDPELASLQAQFAPKPSGECVLNMLD
jgi:hypothetical protein